ncbi:HWE histidine kinase domain-containing protein [Acaryochloris marina]|uniref:histidine kinase n=1 Tax=Acaryochloris marina (strain MBIC 11017) TaxID=329726 RepID=B0C1J9_ACAM1|nr:HWE histidine kinase domain-containing protein [Acaryochloris marina]ABW30833.1 bacteriophytochrome [Acaryochloris marina MBIC11017]BDM79583.1 signal transduction histidine kinase [Acaryochloris marina MBIC10699]
MEIRELAISNCDREPVHIPGRIQIFGALIATDKHLESITHVSSNISDFLGVTPADALGQSLSILLPEEVIHTLRNIAGHPTIATHRERAGVYPLHQSMLDISLHRLGPHFLIELESVPSAQLNSQSAFTKIQMLLARLQDETATSALLQLAVKDLQQVTEFDRVMAYQFLPDGAGEVVAEAMVDELEPNLGLRYPASDIPQQVRGIALKMPIRAISDIDAPTADLIAADPTADPLDLTLTHVRAVSPIHLEYLANMGVQSSMNVAIIVHRELWGLFAFHHNSVKLLPPDYRSICDLFGQLFSLKFQLVLEEERFNNRKHIISAISQITQKLTSSGSFTLTIQTLGPQLCSMLSAQGLAVIDKQEIQTYGDVPALDIIQELVHQVQTHPSPELVPLENLSHLDRIDANQLGKTAGALCLGISPLDEVFVIFFRNEIIHEVRWAGSPEKQIVEGPNGPRLLPRSSFAEYRETVAGQCQSWSSLDTEAALELRTGLMQLAISQGENQQQEWLRQQRQQDLLIAELNHRVKNILALIRSISRQTRHSTTSVEEYTLLLDRRIEALAHAHDLVSGHGLEWPNLQNLLTTGLRPYLAKPKHQVSFSGPEVGLKANFVPMFALVIHELMTNSAKYGALSVPTGKVDVCWREQDGGLAFDWEESDGPTVLPPQRKGFGQTLIERAIPFEFEGEATLRFLHTGIQVNFWLPAHLILLQNDPSEISPPSMSTPQNEEEPDIAPGTVLLVEDNMLLALEMENLLESLGFSDIDTAPRVKQAIKLLDQKQYIMGILDINLKDENSFGVAEELIKRRIPFLFTTGYNSKFTLPESLATVPMLKKPIDGNQLNNTIHQLLA